jgi:RNA polymerase sigma factor (sigma-70 family)
VTSESYGQAYQRGFVSTIRFLRRRGVGRDLADDVAQAAWVKGWERLSQLRNESMVTTWVNAIAINVYRNILRRMKPSGALTDFPGRAEQNIAAIDVVRILKFCKPRDRALLEQHMQGATAHEIAEEQGATVTAIRIRLLRARRAARSRVEQKPCLSIPPPQRDGRQTAAYVGPAPSRQREPSGDLYAT